MKLSIVIVNYNVCRHLEQCLLSVRKASAHIENEVFVVDNNSSDGSITFLQPRFPEVKFIANNENVGFARANNEAIRIATGQYILLLNPDTIIGEASLQTCIDFMDANPQAGGTGVRMLKTNGDFALESRRGLPTPFTALCKMTGLCDIFPRSRKLGRYYMRYLNDREVNEIDIISGAFAFFRHETLKKVGLLDETFFMYGEDIDLSYRILQGGYKNYYLPTPIIHYKGESTEKGSFRYVHVFYQAMLIFFNKHYVHYRFWFSIPIRAAIYFRALMALITQRTDILREKLGIKDKLPPAPRYLLLGSKEMHYQAGEILNKRKLPYLAVEANEQNHPLGHLDIDTTLDHFDFVVYDTDLFSYDTIFHILEKSFGQKRPIELATFSTKRGVIISHQTVIK